jgi:hypothetical protein
MEVEDQASFIVMLWDTLSNSPYFHDAKIFVPR